MPKQKLLRSGNYTSCRRKFEIIIESLDTNFAYDRRNLFCSGKISPSFLFL